jgi:hypothetical protein
MLQWLHWAEAAYKGDKSSLAKALKVHIWILAFTKRRQLVLGLELGLLVFQGFIHGVLTWKK